MRHLPNIITALRIIGLPVFASFVLQEKFWYAFYLMIGLGFSDLLDGFLAKKYQWQSKLGAVLDPFADKILLVSAFCILYSIDLFPLWLMLLIFIRDILVASEYLWLRARVPTIDFKPHWTGKLSTLLQFFLILAVFAVHLQVLPAVWLLPMMNVTAAMVMGSAIIYAVYGRNLWCATHRASMSSTTRRRQYNL